MDHSTLTGFLMKRKPVQDPKSHRLPDRRPHNGHLPWLAGITFLLLGGCAAEISHSKLMPGVASTRTALNVSIAFEDKIDDFCRDKVKSLTGVTPGFFIHYGACSVVQPDRLIKPDALPLCEIFLPRENWQPALQHEILHCMGFDHR
jgi:hypothetical protein